MIRKKFVIAADSFKECLTAPEACQAMAKGIKKGFPGAETVLAPMADGGEGTVEALVAAKDGQIVKDTVMGPSGHQEVEAIFGLVDNDQTAVIETAEASGIALLAKEERKPLTTTSYGTGQQIKQALDLGAKRIIIGLGGSVTNDGGAGIFQALGARFLDGNGEELPLGGGALERLAKIDIGTLDSRLKDVQVIAASDVTNPLTGENGASAVFGPQKGASETDVEKLDKALHNFANVIKQDLGKNIEHLPGAGAAGGIGAGLMAFSNCELKNGAELVIDEIGLKDKVADADYVITGEGKIDFQTKFGKTPFAVAQVAQAAGKPTFAIGGSLGDGIDSLYDAGFTAIFGTISQPGDLKEVLAHGKENVERTSENLARVLYAGLQ